MRHLGPEELIDLVDGRASDSAGRHVQDCDDCQRQLADLTTLMADTKAVDVPEPSPLFWDQLSRQVRDRVAAEPTPRVPWIDRWRRRLSPPAVRRHRWAFGIAAGTFVAVLLAVALPLRQLAPGTQTPSVVTSLPNASVAMNDVSTVASDPELTLMTTLAADVDLDDAAAEGLSASDIVVDRAISELSAAERSELQRLLREELSRAGA